jgi:hypothetical protein
MKNQKITFAPIKLRRLTGILEKAVGCMLEQNKVFDAAINQALIDFSIAAGADIPPELRVAWKNIRPLYKVKIFHDYKRTEPHLDEIWSLIQKGLPKPASVETKNKPKVKEITFTEAQDLMRDRWLGLYNSIRGNRAAQDFVDTQIFSYLYEKKILNENGSIRDSDGFDAFTSDQKMRVLFGEKLQTFLTAV